MIRKLKIGIVHNLRYLKQPGSFGQNLLIRSLGSTSAYLIGFLLSPILARIYLPEAYGQFAVFNALIASLSVLSTLNFNNAFVLPKTGKHFVPLVQLTLMVLVLVTFLMVAGLIFFGDAVLEVFNIQDLGNLIYLLPLFTFLTGISRCLDYWNVRVKEYRKGATSKVASVISAKVSTIILGIISRGDITGFIIGDLISRPIQVLTLLSKSIRNDWYRLTQVSWPRIRWTAREYRDYPLYNMPAEGLTVLVAQLPVYLLSFYYNAEATGYFSLAFSITAAPIQVLGLSVASVYYQQAAEAHGQDPAKMITMTCKLFNKLILLGAIPFGVLIVFGDKVFVAIFGANWETAGVFGSYLAFMAFTNFISVSFTSLFRVLRREKLQFYINLAGSVLLCLGLLIALNSGDEHYLVLAFGFVSSVVNLFALGIAFRLAGIGPIKLLAKMIAIISLVILVLYFIQTL